MQKSELSIKLFMQVLRKRPFQSIIMVKLATSKLHLGLDLPSELTPLEEANDLLCSLNPCIRICLSGLSTHLLLGNHHPFGHFRKRLELREVLWRHVCDVAEIFALLEEFFQIRLIDNLWAGSVDEHRVLWHLAEQSIVDGVLGLGGGRAMQRH